ncbi:NADP-dependent oxidoreductase [Streptomyces sp. NPDC048109]|uniref:NADP-dependent oxidoreductase n=1 Tax=unclassified Streptomyces TaxID=2593676 RepID=UPI0033C26142
MRAIGLRRFGDPDVLEVIDRPLPVPGPGELRIKVAAAAVNPTDLMLRGGLLAPYLTGLDAPYTPGMDASGTVDAVGADVDLAPGQQVVAFVNPLRPEGGAQAEYVVVPRDQAARWPKPSSLVAAGGLPMNALTAHEALALLSLPSGAVLGVTGSAGALGGYVIELAKQRGLRVVADAAPHDRELVHALGADMVVDRGPDVADRFREAAPAGLHGLVDAAVLGAPVLGAVRDGGGYVKCRPYELTTERDISILQVNVAGYAPKRPALEELVELAATGRLTLRSAALLPPQDAPTAHRRLAAGGVRGRHLITF